MKKKIIIERCLECPFYYKRNYVESCAETDLAIENASTIPNWCPLEEDSQQKDSPDKCICGREYDHIGACR